MNILLIVILLVIYMFSLFLKQEKLRTGIFEEGHLHPSSFKMMTIQQIYASDVQCQYKTNLEQNTQFDRKYKKIAKDFLKKFTYIPDEHTFTLRLCSGQWNFDAHFDCVDNTIVMLDGYKTILLFDIYGHPSERDIVDQMKSKTIKQSKDILDSYNISWECVTVKKNENMRIRKRLYHMVESRVPSILLNINYGSDGTCEKHFGGLFAEQNENCKDNFCLD